MNNYIKEYKYENGEIQRVQIVTPDDFSQIKILRPSFSKEAFLKITNLYQNFIVPRFPIVFNRMVLFHVPDEIEIPSGLYNGKYGRIYGRQELTSAIFKDDLKVLKDGSIKCKNPELKAFADKLADQGYLKTVSGKRSSTKILPVSSAIGFLSKEAETSLKVNSNFFIMDTFDVTSVYDTIGTPVGMIIKDGQVINPPLFEREALSVRNNKDISIVRPSIYNTEIEIENTVLKNHENGITFYSRPESSKVVTKGTKLVIIGTRITAVSLKAVRIPSSGFVVNIKDPGKAGLFKPGMEVKYKGFEDISFLIQTGNAIIKNGQKITCFTSKFYSIKKFLLENAFPPSLYPLDFNKDRAPRIALGADKTGKPMILWFEGKGKFSYEPGRDSCGASLSEVAEICLSLGMYNGINLDGGGSAQILIKGKRSLKISDRNRDDNSEAERAVPIGLYIE